MASSAAIVAHISLDYHDCVVCGWEQDRLVRESKKMGGLFRMIRKTKPFFEVEDMATCMVSQWVCSGHRGNILSLEEMMTRFEEKGGYEQLLKEVDQFRHLVHQGLKSYHLRHQHRDVSAAMLKYITHVYVEKLGWCVYQQRKRNTKSVEKITFFDKEQKRHVSTRKFGTCFYSGKYEKEVDLWGSMGQYFYPYHLIVAQLSGENHFPLDIAMKVLSFTELPEKMNQMVQKKPNPQKRKRQD